MSVREVHLPIKRLWQPLILSILMVLFVGCAQSSHGVPTADVSGVITKNGETVAGIEVFFTNETFEGYGRTDESGRYRLVNGAAVGTNKVFMKKFAAAAPPMDDSKTAGLDEKQAMAMRAAQEKLSGKSSGSLIPAEFSDPRTTTLSFSVPEGGTDSADFQL